MPSIIIVEKPGTIKSLSMKTFVESELYKKAALKTPDGFKCYTNWGVEYNKIQYTVYLYGKTSGRSNSENKYEFPPPVDYFFLEIVYLLLKMSKVPLSI